MKIITLEKHMFYISKNSNLCNTFMFIPLGMQLVQKFITSMFYLDNRIYSNIIIIIIKVKALKCAAAAATLDTVCIPRLS